MFIKGQGNTGLKALDDAGRGLAVIATLNVVDKDGDITLPGAFGSGQEAKIVPAHDWGHVPLGKATIREEGDEVLADFQLNLDIPSAKEWHSALKFDLEQGKPLQEWSYGFTITDSGQGEQDGQPVRFLKGLRVHEISPVMRGAGVDTRTVEIKGGKGGTDGVTLAVELANALETVEVAVKRCAEVKSLRAESGRGLQDDKLAELKEIKESLDGLQGVADRINDVLAQPTDDTAIAEQLLSDFTVSISGV